MNALLFILNDGSPISLDCPSGCHEKIDDIKAIEGSKAIQAAFTAERGWAVVDNKGKVHTSPTGVPSGFVNKVNDLAKKGTKVRCISFMTQFSGWCIVTDQGEPFREGIK